MSTALIDCVGDINPTFQHIDRIVKQWGKNGPLKTIILLTRPTLARRDAPCPKQGRRREITGDVPLWYVEDCFEPRTTLGIVFSRPLDEGGERRIHHWMTDELLQPTDHHLFAQRRFI